MRKILFYRDYHGFTGGHLKVWNYFEHVEHSNIFKPKIYFTSNSNFDVENPWYDNIDDRESSWKPELSDALFIAGMDWTAVPLEYNKPVINFIQGLRHSDINDLRYSFLNRPATRICVSEEVADAVTSTGIVNGPVLVIKNGLDTKDLPAKKSIKDIKLLIAGYKQPSLAAQVHESLKKSGIEAHLLTRMIMRSDYLSLVARSAITLFLPCQSEGFYLPALEGMGLETLVICPDCIGNREFCLDMQNCISPIYSLEEIVSACHKAIKIYSTGSAEKIISAGIQQFNAHSLKEERCRFIDVLTSLNI
jgi:glycosyltransferase involved in cell wall biosynthesis